MKIIQITPGSGDTFYCENCLRDKALVRALLAAGHKAMMVPLYLPILGAAPSGADAAPIFFGGVNVYLQQKLAMFRHTPRWLDRLFDSPRLLAWASTKVGMTRARDLADTMISMLRGEHGRQVKELRRLVTWLASNDRPDVVCLSNALLIGLAPQIRKALAVPIVCWLQDEDEFIDALEPADRERAWAEIRSRCGEVDAFIATSRYFADLMSKRLDIPADRMHVIYSGVDPALYAMRDKSARPVIGYMARMCRHKGLDMLAQAFITLRKEPGLEGLQLRPSGGKTDSDEPFLAEIRQALDAAGASADVEFLPNLMDENKVRYLRGLSVLAVPERTGEAAGQYVLEAMACGVPVVQPSNGCFGELIEPTGGGLLHEPNNLQALTDALRRVLLDGELSDRLGLAGRAGTAEKFSAARSAAALVDVCQQAMTLNTKQV